MDFTWIAALAGVTLTAGFGFINESLRDRRARRHESRTNAREDAKERGSFEITSLRQCFDDVLVFGRAATLFHLDDYLAARDGGFDYASRRHTDPTALQHDEDVRLANVALTSSTALLLDDGLRETITALQSQYNLLGSRPRPIAEAAAMWLEMMPMFDEALQRVGAAIRAQYLPR